MSHLIWLIFLWGFCGAFVGFCAAEFEEWSFMVLGFCLVVSMWFFSNFGDFFGGFLGFLKWLCYNECIWSRQIVILLMAQIRVE